MAVLLALVTLLGSAACSQSPEVKKEKALERGERYLKENKINEAIIEIRIALQIDPEFAPALRALGEAYAEKSWNFDAWRELSYDKRWGFSTQTVKGFLSDTLKGLLLGPVVLTPRQAEAR